MMENTTDNTDVAQNKSLTDLSREAFWFGIHTLIAMAVLVLSEPDSPSSSLCSAAL
jgi:hypothetical protein